MAATREQLERRLLDLADDARQFIDNQDPDGEHRVIAEVVLIIGTRAFSPQGKCFGTVYTFGNESSIPGYVARGLLREAIDTIEDIDT